MGSVGLVNVAVVIVTAAGSRGACRASAAATASRVYLLEPHVWGWGWGRLGVPIMGTLEIYEVAKGPKRRGTW